MNLIQLRNAEVYAPDPLGRQDLLLGGGRILALEPSLPPLPKTLNAQTIDIEGRRGIRA